MGGIEVVGLAQVDEQADVALLGLAAAGAFAFGLLLLLAGAAFGHHLNFGRVAIVLQEAVELQRHHALDDVLLLQPVELAVDGRQEVGNLLLVDLHLLDFVDDLDELLLAYLLAGGHFAGHEFLVDYLLYLAHAALFAQVHDGYRGARLSGAARASAAVGVALGVVGQAVVDDVGQVVDVESAGGHVGGHEQLQVSLAELLHHEVALLLGKLAVQ